MDQERSRARTRKRERGALGRRRADERRERMSEPRSHVAREIKERSQGGERKQVWERNGEKEEQEKEGKKARAREIKMGSERERGRNSYFTLLEHIGEQAAG